MIRLSVPHIRDEECRAVERVLRSGQLVHGEECDLFEKELASYLGVDDVVVVSSCTAALHLSLVVLGIGPGDAVLVPDFTFPATANVVEMVGARPVFVDVDLTTYNVTSAGLREAIVNWKGPERLRAIIPVHEFGCPADMTGIMALAKENDLMVIEDAACALGTTHQGRKAGTFGQLGCFSFHPRKAMTTGEGGAIAVNNEELAQRLRNWRNHGILRTPDGTQFLVPGFNYRLTNIQAALGRVQLIKFDSWLKKRRELQQIYQRQLEKIHVALPKAVNGHAWQTYMVVLPDYYNRDQVIQRLKTVGIETNLGAQALHTLTYYNDRYPGQSKRLAGNNSERLARQGLALPFHQDLEGADLCLVIENLKNMLK